MFVSQNSHSTWAQVQLEGVEASYAQADQCMPLMRRSSCSNRKSTGELVRKMLLLSNTWQSRDFALALDMTLNVTYIALSLLTQGVSAT